MKQYGNYVKIFSLAAVFAAIMTCSLPARAQNMNEPWSFNGQNRASIAALMNTVENNSSGTTAGTVGGSVTNLVCGNGADSATSTGNSACIILNNSAGSGINTEQDSLGDQTSDNAQTTTVTENINGPPQPEGLTDVLEGLGAPN